MLSVPGSSSPQQALGVPCVLHFGHFGLHGLSPATTYPPMTLQVHFHYLSVIWLFIPAFHTSVMYF